MASLREYPKRPWSCQLEPVEGCNRQCFFCGNVTLDPEGKLLSKKHFMDPKAVAELFRQINEWLPKIRVELNNLGEPSFHPDLWAVVSAIRQNMSTASIQVTTNTEPWFTKGLEWINSFFAAGGNTLIMNCYTEGFYEIWKDRLEGWGIPYLDYHHNNPKGESPHRYRDPRSKLVMLCDDLAAMNEARIPHLHKTIHSMAGANDAAEMERRLGRKRLAQPLVSACTKPFREFTVGYNGEVTACCLDWHHKLVMGNMFTEGVQEVWYGPRFTAMRHILYRKVRVLDPCRLCDERANRPGLEQHPGELPAPMEELLQFIQPRTEPY